MIECAIVGEGKCVDMDKENSKKLERIRAT
jgi:hypothetical protein